MAFRNAMTGADSSGGAGCVRPHQLGNGVPDGLPPLAEELQREIEGLRKRQQTRAVIDQAEGSQITRAEAFQRLRRISQRANARLVDVAAAWC